MPINDEQINKVCVEYQNRKTADNLLDIIDHKLKEAQRLTRIKLSDKIEELYAKIQL